MIQPDGTPRIHVDAVLTVTPTLQNPPQDHLILNVLATLFCCWPIGICAILQSTATMKAVKRADAETAKASSARAKRLGYITIGAGVLFYTTVLMARFILPHIVQRS